LGGASSIENQLVSGRIRVASPRLFHVPGSGIEASRSYPGNSIGVSGPIRMFRHYSHSEDEQGFEMLNQRAVFGLRGENMYCTDTNNETRE